ncbi:MAG: hypothetical protein K6T78_00710 [Alicyclobacillus sp.]|nr:hypothetical protein [Alicyclobacillus sp.]
MGWSDEIKPLFDALNQHVSLRPDAKRRIRERLHEEMDARVATSPDAGGERVRQRRVRLRVALPTGAAVAAAALVVAVLQWPGAPWKNGPAGGRPGVAVGSGSVSGPVQSVQKGGSTNGLTNVSSGSQGISSAGPNQAISLQAPQLLTLTRPLAMFGADGWRMQPGALQHTRDGGQTWRTVQTWTVSAGTPAVGAAIDGNELRLALGQVTAQGGGRTEVLRTENGGQTWESATVADTRPSDPAGHIPASIAFSDARHGWLTTSAMNPGMGGTVPGGLYRTTDGGATWHLVPNPFPTGLDAFPWVQFTSGTLGFTEAAPQAAADVGVSTGQYRLFRTTDGGAHWQPVTPAPSGAEKVDWLPPQVAGGQLYTAALESVAGGARTLVVYRSDDEGRTWQAIHTFPAASSLAALAADRQGIWVDWAGELWTSADGGQTFTRTPAPPGAVTGLAVNQAVLYAFVTPRHSSAQTAASDVYQTVNGGATWQKVK